MQKFFTFMALFAALLFGADFAITALFDRFYQQLRTGQTGGEINYYLSLPKQPELLVMGNSRARYQVNPDSFAVPTHSLCHAGMGQVFQTGLLKVLAQEKKLPSAILLHVEFEDYSGFDNLEDVGNLRYYYRKVPEVTARINEISTFERIKYLFRFYRYNGRVISTVKNLIQSRTADYAGNGYQAAPAADTDSTALFTAASDATPPGFHNQNLHHLKEFIAECKRRHIRLLCFASPYFSAPAFASVAAPRIDSLLRAEQVPYLNTATQLLPVLKNHASFWLDEVHLNQLGAGHLSRQLAHWSKPYLLGDSLVTVAR